MRALERIICALIVALLMSLPLSAQSTTGTINGRVSDASDAVIPGVSVTLTSPVIQGSQNVITDEAGTYRFILLPPGTYALKYELPGFKTVLREGIIVQGSRTVTLPITLDVATVAETVTVSGESPVVDVQNATIGVAFNTTLLRDLPNQRDVWAVLGQTPGITMTRFDVGGSTAGTQTGYRGYGISGQQWITVDGVSTTEGAGTGAGMYYDYGAFAEITVQAAANSAEVALAGVYTNTVMKTGGNQIRGQAYLDWEDKSFQGDNITQALKDQGLTQSDKFARYNDFNFNAGGPFKKDKFWWFASIKDQYIGLTTPLNKSATDLTGGGTFSTRLGGVSAKLNYQLTPKNQLAWSMQRTTKGQPFRNGQGANAKNYIIDSTQNEQAWYMTNKGQITSIISNRMTLDGAWLWYHLYDPRYVQSKATPYSDTQTGIVRGAFGAENDTYRNRHQFYVNLAYNKSGLGGSHDFKFGYGEIYENNGGKTDCEFNDAPHSTVPCVTLTYTNGAPNTVVVRDAPLPDNKNEMLSTYFFAQDKWQIGRRLTANIGVRFDRYHSWFPESTNPGTGPFASTQFFPTARFKTPYARQDMPILQRVVPRVALAYDVFGNTKTAVKGSWGRYTENTSTFASNINPLAVHSNTYGGCTATVRANCWDGSPVTLAMIAAMTPQSTTGFTALPTVDPNLKLAYTDEYTAGIEQQIVPDLGFSALYVRKVGHLDRGILNRTYKTNEFAPVTGIDLGPDGLLNTSDDKRVTIYERVPATRGSDLLLTNFDSGSNYSTIEFTVTKRFTKKWQLITGYDWTKLNRDRCEGCPGVSSTAGFGGTTSLDPNVTAIQNGHYHQWTYKVLGVYQFPKGIQVSGTWNAQQGAPYSRSMQFSSALRNILNPDGTTRTSNLRQGAQTIWIEPNAYYLPATKLINLRVEKKFRITERQSIDGMFDVFNIFNWNTVVGRDSTTARLTVSGKNIPRFGAANGILSPVIFRLGVRYSF